MSRIVKNQLVVIVCLEILRICNIEIDWFSLVLIAFGEICEIQWFSNCLYFIPSMSKWSSAWINFHRRVATSIWASRKFESVGFWFDKSLLEFWFGFCFVLVFVSKSSLKCCFLVEDRTETYFCELKLTCVCWNRTWNACVETVLKNLCAEIKFEFVKLSLSQN